MEIIKEHKKEISKRIEIYNEKKEEHQLIILSSSLLLIFIGCIGLFSFFVGSYILLYLTLLSFSISLVLFTLNTYHILINREEIKRLSLIKDNKLICDEIELKEFIQDIFKYIKNYFYENVIKIINLIEKNKSKI